jgi:hypothetical protein
MADFGQRYTFGYDTYNLVFNIGTMSNVVLCFAFFILIVYAVLRYLVCCRLRKHLRMYLT